MPQLFLQGAHLGEVNGVLFDKDGTLSNSEKHLIQLAHRRINEATSHFQKNFSNYKKTQEVKKLLAAAYGITSDGGLRPEGTVAVAGRQSNLISTATVFSLLGESWPSALQLAEKVFSKVERSVGEGSNKIVRRPLLPGAKKILKALNQSGVKCAVISNDTLLGIQNFLTENNLQTIISHTWSAEQRPSKPNPDAVIGLCSEIGVPPQSCALIGDADSDLVMAKQAGIGIRLGYVAGWSKKPHLTAHQHLVHDWNDLVVAENLKVPNIIGSL